MFLFTLKRLSFLSISFPKVLKENEEGHKKLAKLLLEREVIFSEDLEKIFGKRPWDDKKLIDQNGNNDSNTTEEKKEKVQVKKNSENKSISA